jgi:hypothetical protein
MRKILANQFIKKDEEYQFKQIINYEQHEPTNIEELDGIIKNLKNNKSPGPDEVTNKVIYESDKIYLVDLYNLLIKRIEIPKASKDSKMINIPKANKPTNIPSSYRPISLINGWYKIAERLLINRLKSKLNQIEFFSPIQFGFTKRKSTIKAVKQIKI